MTYEFPLLLDYEFTNLEESKILSVYCSDTLQGNADALRNTLGNYWYEETDEDGNVTIAPHLLEVEAEIQDLRGRYVSRMDAISDYIQKVEINPYKITPIASDVFIPNYKIPIRMYANEENTRGDKFWQTLFTGGSFGETSYPSLINDKTIFYDEAFRYQIPYSQMETKHTQTTETAHKICQITYDYNYYNSFVKKYQEWSAGLESELLLPNWDIIRLFSQMTMSLGAFSDLYSETARIKEILNYYSMAARTGLPPPDVLGPDEEEIDPLTTTIPELVEIFDQSTAGAIEAIGNRDSGRDMFAEFMGLMIQSFDRQSSTHKNKVIEQQKNIILDNDYFVNGLMTAEADEYVDNLPYYVKTTFPRHRDQAIEQGPRPIGITQPLHRDWSIRDSIADNNASAKFLEILKDVHNNEFPTVKFGYKSFEATLGYISGSSADRVDVSDLSTTTYRGLDFPFLLTEMYNQYSASLNSDYTFASLRSDKQDTTYTDTDLYRFYDNQNILGVLSDLTDTMNTYMDLAKSVEARTREWIMDEAPEVGLEEAVPAKELLEALFNPSYKHTETLAYRVEKRGGVTVGDQANSNVIQNYWIFNSSDAPDDLTLYDSQVKYGENYTYQCYAYVLVLGHRYRYGDFRLTKQIATIDVDPEVDGAEYYCLQFYDPRTKDFVDQIFFDGTGLEPGDADDILTSALAIGVPDFPESANEFATSKQELSKHPHLAECYLYIEPCLKLLEIPLCSKALKVLDSPANDMITMPFQFLDNSQGIGFNTVYESFLAEPYPINIKDSDLELRNDYLHAKDLFTTDNIVFQSESPPRYVEVYRMDTPPAALTDFASKHTQTIDLLVEDSEYTYSQAIVNDVIQTNKKYYYLFRFLSENKMPGHLSQIIEAELIDDGGYIYSSFKTLDDSDLEREVFVAPSKNFKKIIQLQPHVAQLTLDDSAVDYRQAAGSQLSELKVGISDESLFEPKTFKLRLTSKKTGEQIDLNVTFNIKEEDRWSATTPLI